MQKTLNNKKKKKNISCIEKDWLTRQERGIQSGRDWADTRQHTKVFQFPFLVQWLWILYCKMYIICTLTEEE